MFKPMLMLGALCAGLGLAAQEKAKDKGPIQDNSFLLEEAYNQEPGVVQHISAWQRFQQTKDWFYTFTQEWPVPGNTHQFSYTLPFQRVQLSPDGRQSVGDVLLNYRYQLLGDGEAPVAIAPRFSLILPTGDYGQLRGSGAVGYQVNVAMSTVLSDRFVAHTNLGGTLIPKARNPAGERADLRGWNAGQSLIWLTGDNFNVMLEGVVSSMDTVAGPGLTERVRTAFINPGFRWAINCRSGLQIVPGISFPIGVGASSRERAVFVYLSFEGSLWKP
jgi:hypothetical protein